MSENILRLARADMYTAQLDGLSTAMARCNFVVGLELFGFNLVAQGAFTIELLSELLAQYKVAERQAQLRAEYPDAEAFSGDFFVDGELELTNLKKVQDGVDEVLFWSSGAWNRKDPIAESIRNLYWDIVMKVLSDKPDVFLVHYPKQDSYFDEIGRTFCFVLIAGSTGVVLSGFASD